MRIIFMGTPDFAVPTLDAIVDAGHEVLAVVAQPDRPSGRGRKLTSPPTIQRARALGLTTKQPRAIKRGPFPEWMTHAGADLAVVVAYGRILTPTLLAAPAHGCVNIHASLLPALRGAAPIHWAIVRGHQKTGITTMMMAEGLDTGDMLLQRETDIGPDETVGQLWDRLSVMGAALLVETLQDIHAIPRRPQDHGAATFAPLLKKEDGRVDWSQPAQAVHDRIRGMIPWPGAHTTLRGERMKLHGSRMVPGADKGAPGQVLSVQGALIVATGDGAIEITAAQLPGKRAQPGDVFVQGARIEPGEVLE